jgi:DNA-binding response OmpR family regulator
MFPLQNKKSILIVDDSDVIRDTLRSYFTEYDFEILTCPDGLEGIKKVIDYHPSLIFLDLMMPNLDGVKMLQVIKVIDNVKNIPVIVISANTNRSNVLSALEAGADRVVPKPLQKDILEKNINELLGPDFLRDARTFNSSTEKQNKEIQEHLRKFFLDNFSKNKLRLVNALKAQDEGVVFNITHDIKGSGGTIGYPILSVISYEIEKALENRIVDWLFITSKCQQIFSIIEKIEYPRILAER